MSVIELIGFVIAMIAFFALLWKQAREQKRRREHPEEFEREQEEKEEALRELMESLHMPVPVEKKRLKTPPPPPPEIEEEEEFIEVEGIEEKRIPLMEGKAALFRDIYAKEKPLLRGSAPRYEAKTHRFRVKKTLRSVDSLKEALILREILGPPKGMQ